MNIVSLFSGAGGMDLGFKEAGHKIVWANDVKKDCVNTYKLNLGDHIVEGDIRDITSESMPLCDAVIGGFPCQGFSQANMRKYPTDERNKLYLQFVRVVRDKRPRFFIAENVRGILSYQKGEVLREILAAFSEEGYEVQHRLFNAADFGVPQNRLRVIFAGIRNDVFDGRFPFPTPTHSRLGGEQHQPWVTVSEALETIPEPESEHTLINHIYSKYKVTNRNFTGHRRTDPSKPAPTILAKDTGGNVALNHPRNHRRVSVRESAILQTFPLDFEFTGQMGSMYRQIGNAVPPLFARKLGDALANFEFQTRAAGQKD